MCRAHPLFLLDFSFYLSFSFPGKLDQWEWTVSMQEFWVQATHCFFMSKYVLYDALYNSDNWYHDVYV